VARVQLPVFVSAKWVIHDLIASTARSVITLSPSSAVENTGSMFAVDCRAVRRRRAAITNPI